MKHQARLCYTSVEKELGLSAHGKHSSRYCSRGGWPADRSLKSFDCVSLAQNQSYSDWNAYQYIIFDNPYLL